MVGQTDPIPKIIGYQKHQSKYRFESLYEDNLHLRLKNLNSNKTRLNDRATQLARIGSNL